MAANPRAVLVERRAQSRDGTARRVAGHVGHDPQPRRFARTQGFAEPGIDHQSDLDVAGSHRVPECVEIREAIVDDVDLPTQQVRHEVRGFLAAHDRHLDGLLRLIDLKVDRIAREQHEQDRPEQRPEHERGHHRPPFAQAVDELLAEHDRSLHGTGGHVSRDRHRADAANRRFPLR